MKDLSCFCHPVGIVSENRNIIPTWVKTSWTNKGATLGFYFHETNEDFGCASEGDDFSFKDAFNRSVMSYLYETENLSKFKAVSEPTALPKFVGIHIEEPELSLFPDAQCKLIENMLYTASHANEDRKLNMMLATHSPYILNYLNIVLNQTKAGRAKMTSENLAVYRIYEGELQNLVVMDDKENWIVDTYDLSEMMNTIYNEYVSLGV